MGTTQNQGVLDILEIVISRLRQKPILQIVTLNVLILIGIGIFDQYFFNNYPLLLVCIMFFPLLPAYYTERRWSELKVRYEQMTVLDKKTEKLIPLFLIFGLVFSAVFFFVGRFHFFIITSPVLDVYREEGYSIGEFFITPEFSKFVLYYLIFGLALVIVTYKFHLITYTDDTIDEGTTQRYFNHPGIMTTQLSYFLIGSIVFLILALPFRMSSISSVVGNSTIGGSGSELYQNGFFLLNVSAFDFSLAVLFIFPVFILTIMSLHTYYLPFFTRGRSIDLSDSNKLREYLIYFLLLVAVFSYISFNMIDPTSSTDTLEFRNYTSLIVSILISLFIIRRNFYAMELCDDCGFYGDKKCMFCKNSNNRSNSLLVGSDLEAPACPNCDQKWDNLSRRCSYCKYTIVLTCENCSQTVNPLWRKCNLCEMPRAPVPEIALSPQQNNNYALIRARYLIIILIVLPIVVIEVFYINYLRSNSQIAIQEDVLSETLVNLVIQDNYHRIIIWIGGILAILLLIYYTLNSAKQSQLKLVDMLFRTVITPLIPLAALIFVIEIWLIKIPILYYLVLVGIVLTVLIGFLYYGYRKISGFEPYNITFYEKGGTS